MRFPYLLKCRKCKPLPEKKINEKNLMYSRHAPDSEWKRGEEFPDTNQIKMNQSFNWSAFSIPVWVKFDPEKEFKRDHGVCAFPVYAIRKAHLYSPELPENFIGVEHDPKEYNFSHCQLYSENKPKRAIRMAFRLALKKNATPKIQPYTKVTFGSILVEFFRMIKHRLIVLFS